tara:strand:- start:165 stop:521 length:357 start_codon:yes stop_codon:yes gene_type:complete
MKTLYEKIGGEKSVDLAVEIFYKKVLNDPIICDFFNNVDMKKQKVHQKRFLTVAFGGPNNYTGNSMRSAHKHLNLNESHFQAVSGHITSTLYDLEVPENLIQDVNNIIDNVHDEVLNL